MWALGFFICISMASWWYDFCYWKPGQNLPNLGHEKFIKVSGSAEGKPRSYPFNPVYFRWPVFGYGRASRFCACIWCEKRVRERTGNWFFWWDIWHLFQSGHWIPFHWGLGSHLWQPSWVWPAPELFIPWFNDLVEYSRRGISSSEYHGSWCTWTVYPAIWWVCLLHSVCGKRGMYRIKRLEGGALQMGWKVRYVLNGWSWHAVSVCNLEILFVETHSGEII